MAFKTFAPGVLTSSDVNTFLMRQAVITCTSSTRPASPSEGMTIYETDTDLTRQYDGSAWEVVTHIGAWQTYTPTLSDYGGGTSWAIGNGTLVGKYQRVGRMIFGYAHVTFGSTTTFGTNSIKTSVPLAPTAPALSNTPIGALRAYDVSSGNAFTGFVEQAGGSTIAPGLQSTSLAWTTAESITNTRPFTWASGDYMLLTFGYEAAS